jgi:hypothetical protein
MDLTFSAGDEDFRREFGAWLDDERPRGRLNPVATPDGLRQHLDWESKLCGASSSTTRSTSVGIYPSG